MSGERFQRANHETLIKVLASAATSGESSEQNKQESIEDERIAGV